MNRTHVLLAALAFAAVALLAAAGTTAATTQDAGVATVGTATVSDVGTTYCQPTKEDCDCPDKRICAGSASLGDAVLTSDDDDCFVSGCGCPDPRICGGSVAFDDAVATVSTGPTDLGTACRDPDCCPEDMACEGIDTESA